MLNSSKLDEPVGAGASRRPKTAGKKRRNLCGGVYINVEYKISPRGNDLLMLRGVFCLIPMLGKDDYPPTYPNPSHTPASVLIVPLVIYLYSESDLKCGKIQFTRIDEAVPLSCGWKALSPRGLRCWVRPETPCS